MNFKKSVSFFVWGCLVVILFVPLISKANVDVWGSVDSKPVNEIITEKTGLTYRDPRVVVANIIQLALSFLGIIAVILILIGGFKWMTAGGNDDQVGEAKKWIYSGVIGLLIILSAYALANFVVTQLSLVTTT